MIFFTIFDIDGVEMFFADQVPKRSKKGQLFCTSQWKLGASTPKSQITTSITTDFF